MNIAVVNSGNPSGTPDILTSGLDTNRLPPTPPTQQQILLKLIETYVDEADKFKTNSPKGPIALISVTSYVQLPIILDMLQRSPDSIRLTFPTPADTDPNKATILAEQKEIHKLISERHSKTLGEIVKHSMTLIEKSHIFTGQTDADKAFALQFLGAKANPSDTNTATLQVDQIYKASGTPTELNDQLVQGLQAGTTAKTGIIFELPADSQTVLSARAEAQKISLTPLSAAPVKVWIGSPVVVTKDDLLTNPPPHNFDELEFEKFIKSSQRDLDTLARQQPKGTGSGEAAAGGSGAGSGLLGRAFFPFGGAMVRALKPYW